MTLDLEEHRIRRDGEGEVLPETVEVQGSAVEIKPMSLGRAEEMFGSSGRVAEVGWNEVAELISDQVVYPDFDAFVDEDDDFEGDELTGDILAKEFKGGLPVALIEAIQEVSGFGGDAAETGDGDGVAVSFRG